MADEGQRIERARLEKLVRREDAGLRGFPTAAERTHQAAAVQADFATLEGSRVCVAGRVGVFKKLGKNLTFVFLRDGSGQIQLILHPSELDEATGLVLETLDPGDFVSACGKVIKSKTGEVSIEVDQLTFLGKSLRNPPEKWHGLVDVETRYRQRYLDLMANPDVRQVFLTRSRVISAIRGYLDALGFVEVETPLLHPSPGGGPASPFATDSMAMATRRILRVPLGLTLNRSFVAAFS